MATTSRFFAILDSVVFLLSLAMLSYQAPPDVPTLPPSANDRALYYKAQILGL